MHMSVYMWVCVHVCYPQRPEEELQEVVNCPV